MSADIRCPSCGRLTHITPTGGIGLHRRLGSPSEKCLGWPVHVSEVSPQPDSVSLVLKLRSGKVFRYDVPLGLSDDERAQVAQAIETLHASMARSLAKAGAE